MFDFSKTLLYMSLIWLISLAKAFMLPAFLFHFGLIIGLYYLVYIWVHQCCVFTSFSNNYLSINYIKIYVIQGKIQLVEYIFDVIYANMWFIGLTPGRKYWVWSSQILDIENIFLGHVVCLADIQLLIYDTQINISICGYNLIYIDDSWGVHS